MKYHNFTVFAFSCIATIILSGCSPLSHPKETASLANSEDSIFYLLDPEVTTEGEAFSKAESSLKQGKLDNALFYYVKTLQFNNKNIKALEQIAAIHNHNKHPELTLKIYRDILAIDSQHALANESLGLYYLENGQVGKAKEHLTTVVNVNNKSWKAHNGLGVINDLEHNSDSAKTHYEAALAIEPSNPMLLNNLGYSYYLSGNQIKAKYLFSQSLSQDNRYKRAIQNLALIHIKSGNYSNAAALFNRIMAIHDSFNNIGYICMLNGQYDVAEEYLRRAIDESPVYFPKAQENLKTLLSLRSGSLSYEQRQPLFTNAPNVKPALSDNTTPAADTAPAENP